MGLKTIDQYLVTAQTKARTHVGSGSAILEVTIALMSDVPRDTDGSTTVGDTAAELTNVTSLVFTGETQLVALSIDRDVLDVLLRHALDRSVDGVNAALLTHCLGAVIGVGTSTVPVTWQGLGRQRDCNAPLLRDADQEVTCHPEVVAHGDALAWTDLEFPLRRHYFGIDARDVDARIQASAVVGLHDVASEDPSGA